jgi:hypothetical protein
MASKRTAKSTSPIDGAESRMILASIKRDLRRVERDIRALSPTPIAAAEPPTIDWDVEPATDGAEAEQSEKVIKRFPPQMLS